MNICIFGDSITYGACDLEKGGWWVNRLRLYLENETDFEDFVYNLGIPGDDTNGILARFDTEINSRMPEILIFNFGLNDSFYSISQKRNNISIEKFEQNVKELMAKSKKITNGIVFIGLTPADEAKTTPIPWNTDKVYKNEYIKKYNNKIKEICKEEKLDFIDLFSETISMDYKKMLFDGLRPNAEGHEWIFNKVTRSLNNSLNR